MLNLYVNTTEDALFFALKSPTDTFIYEKSIQAQRSHSALLVPLMQEAFATLHVQPKQLKALYVCVGPGSFTGLRAGVTLVRALGQQLPQLKIYALNRFQLNLMRLGQHAPKEAFLMGIIARRGQGFWCTLQPTPTGWVQAQPPWLAGCEVLQPPLPKWCMTDAPFLSEAQAAGLTAQALSPLLEAFPLKLSHFEAATEAFQIPPTPWPQLDALYLQAPSISPPTPKEFFPHAPTA